MSNNPIIEVLTHAAELNQQQYSSDFPTLNNIPPGIPKILNDSPAQYLALSTTDTIRRTLRYHGLAARKAKVLGDISTLEQEVNSLNAELDIIGHDLRSCLYIHNG